MRRFRQRARATPDTASRGARRGHARAILWTLAAALPAASAAHETLPSARWSGTDRPIAQAPDAGAAPAPATTRTPLAELLGNARRQIDAGQAEAAWRALEARLDDYAGDPEFDYLLGLAALDSGHPGRAILALERVLIVRPDFLQARAEIARAYFVARERENARREFETVAAQRVPEPVRQVISRYLDAIQRIDEESRGKLTGVLEVELGYDSNVNFGSASGQWVLADGTAVTPLAASLPRSSNTLGAALAAAASGPVSASLAGPLAGKLEWNLGARASLRRYDRVSDFDQEQFDVSGGLSLRNGCHRYTVAALLQHLRLDGQAYRNASGALLQWQCETDPRTLIGATLQSFRLDFPGAGLRDARRNAVGLNAARILDTASRPILIGSIAAGEETSRAGLDNLSHDFVSLRAGVVARLSADWRSTAVLAWETRDFDGVEPLFGTAREDRQIELRIEFERRVNNRTFVAPQIVHTRNRSTLSPNDFRRTEVGVQLRHRF